MDAELTVESLGMLSEKLYEVGLVTSKFVSDNAIQTIRELQSQIPKWHYVDDGDLPSEHNSMFARFKGTEKWDKAMFEKISDDVIVAIKDKNGRCVTTNAHTVDGKWKCDLLRASSVFEVVAWMELPKFEEVE